MWLLATLPRLPGSYLPDGTSLLQPASGSALAVALEVDTQVLTPLHPHRVSVYSPSEGSCAAMSNTRALTPLPVTASA